MLAQSVAGSLTARAQGKALDVEIKIAKRLPGRISGDEVRLRSALENLIDNAVKFTERGRIGFTTSSAAMGRGRVRLTFTITDSGIGITAADLKRLFRPFAQASEEVARRYGGAGLGLVFVKRIAKAMGGDLVVTSKPGRGSTFRLTVVMKDASSAVRRRAPGATPAASLNVLCVEDNPYGRIVHSAVLRELGHVVNFVGSGEAAVETVAANEHDVVLMDIALAGIDGNRGDPAHPRAAGAGGPHPDYRRLGPHRAARCRGRDGGRHERLFAQARVARRVERGAAEGGQA